MTKSLQYVELYICVFCFFHVKLEIIAFELIMTENEICA